MAVDRVRADADGAESRPEVSEWTYSIEEAAVRLGVESADVRRGLREGWFPGRFLSDARLRLPRSEVDSAVEAWRQFTVIEPDIEESTTLPGERALVRGDVADLKEALLTTLRSERQALLEEILMPLQQQARRMEGLEAQVRGLREQMEASRALAPPTGRRGVDALVQEIADLERALGAFGDDLP